GHHRAPQPESRPVRPGPGPRQRLPVRRVRGRGPPDRAHAGRRHPGPDGRLHLRGGALGPGLPGREGAGGRRVSPTVRAAPRFWAVDSTPFSWAGDPPQPCRIVLRQVDDNDFELVETLVYTPPEDVPDRPAAPLVIRPGWLTSDLASIPGILGWFARRHGRHTPAALVHDFLIAD